MYVAEPDSWWQGCVADLRPQERQAIYTSHTVPTFKILMDKRIVSQHEAVSNLIQTWVIIFLLAGGAMLFSNDSNLLVIGPLESMMAKVIILNSIRRREKTSFSIIIVYEACI